MKSDELFDFQHYNRISDDYNFLIGWNTISNEIDGIVGLIPVSHYDVMLYPNNESWGGIWKIREDVHNDEIGVLGLLLFEWFLESIHKELFAEWADNIPVSDAKYKVQLLYVSKLVKLLDRSEKIT